MRVRVDKLPEDAVKSKNTAGLYLTPGGSIYGFDKRGYYLIIPYINRCYNGTNHNKKGYYKFHYRGKMHRVHYELARTFIPGYKPGLTVDHIDNDSLNNRLDNLQWVTRGENVEKFWNSLSDEEYKEYKLKYSNGLKKAHADGKYKEHLKKLHNKKRKSKK